MSETPEKVSILRKALNATEAVLDSQIHKAKKAITPEKDIENSDFLFGKAVTEDPTYAPMSAGWKEKPSRIQNGHLKQMAKNDSIVAAIIQTRQNQVAGHSRYVDSHMERGWTLVLRDEEKLLDEIKQELKGQGDDESGAEGVDPNLHPDDHAEPIQSELHPDDQMEGEESDAAADQNDKEVIATNENENDDQDDADEHNWENERQAKALLEERFKEDRSKAKEFILKCGVIESEDYQKPFHADQWTFDGALRAWVRDSLTYDLYASECVYAADGSLSYFFPVDGATIKYSSNRFKDYESLTNTDQNLDLLFSDDEAVQMQDQRTVELDQELLDANAYKWVQVVLGRIERAFTTEELKVGIRNPTTDLHYNGYGVSELEILVSLVTGHLNAEYYNQSYFTQGFSAKGILHIKAALNRRKLETFRTQWQHMLKGSRNSFQTPIIAGMEGVEWIKLDQSHQDIGFEGWLRYLIKMICAIYQIDPQEIGVGLKEEGGSGGGLSGDNTEEKLTHSKEKGLEPLMRHIENYVNESILINYDDRFIFKFTGTDGESDKAVLERQKIEGELFKTVNEIRDEHALQPLPGMDDFIMSPTYAQWYSSFSEAGKEANAAMMGGGEDDGFGDESEGGFDEEEQSPFGDMYDQGEKAQEAFDNNYFDKSLKKSKKPHKVKIEYYQMEE